MDSIEYEQYLHRTLTILESIVNFIERQGKHIVAYNKLLGVYQKLRSINDEDKRDSLYDISNSIKISIDNLVDGKYKDSLNQVKDIRTKLYLIYGRIKKENENNSN